MSVGTVNSSILAYVGGVFLLLSAAGMFSNNDVLAGMFGLFALCSFLASVLAPRMRGEVKASLDGFRFEVVEEIARRAPERGLSTEELARAIRTALRENLTGGATCDGGSLFSGEISLDDDGKIEIIAERLMDSSRQD